MRSTNDMKRPSAALPPSIIVIFGITGDLSKRYLLPALYHLFKDGLLHEQTAVVGVTRQAVTSEALLDEVELCVSEVDKICDPVVLKQLRQATQLVQMDLAAAADYSKLLNRLNSIEDSHGTCMNRLYYLSIPPQVYGSAIQLLGGGQLNTTCQHGTAETRLLIEKPFGYDLASAKALVSDTDRVFQESQVYRIDHYLAKETVQNILTFRFHNAIFEHLWDARYIESVEIGASEKIGIEGRAHFYDTVGALRDFIQSHLLQLLAIVTMDQPDELSGTSLHDQKQRVLEQIATIPADSISSHAFRAQYEAYRSEVANPDSGTETFAAVLVEINSKRWQGVPIIMWTGKSLAEKKTEICITFKPNGMAPANRLRFRIQPNEGIELELVTKRPGFESQLQTVAMAFSYRQNFGGQPHANAYERVLADAIRGDQTLFATSREVLEAWRIVQPVLAAWERDNTDLQAYRRGTAGATLLERWRQG